MVDTDTIFHCQRFTTLLFNFCNISCFVTRINVLCGLFNTMLIQTDLFHLVGDYHAIQLWREQHYM